MDPVFEVVSELMRNMIELEQGQYYVTSFTVATERYTIELYVSERNEWMLVVYKGNKITKPIKQISIPLRDNELTKTKAAIIITRYLPNILGE